MWIRLYMYPVQTSSLMYLIFAKKQRIKFFDPQGGRIVQKMFHPDQIRFCESFGLLLQALLKPVLPRWLTRTYLNDLVHS